MPFSSSSFRDFSKQTHKKGLQKNKNRTQESQKFLCRLKSKWIPLFSSSTEKYALGQIIFKNVPGEECLAYMEATLNKRNRYCKMSYFYSNKYGNPEYTRCFGCRY